MLFSADRTEAESYFPLAQKQRCYEGMFPLILHTFSPQGLLAVAREISSLYLRNNKTLLTTYHCLSFVKAIWSLQYNAE